MTTFGVLADYYSLPSLPGKPDFKGYDLVREHRGYGVRISRDIRRGLVFWEHVLPDKRVFTFEFDSRDWRELDYLLQEHERFLMSLVPHMDEIWNAEIRQLEDKELSLKPRPVEPEGINRYVKYVDAKLVEVGDFLLYIRAYEDRITYGIVDPLKGKEVFSDFTRWTGLPYLIYASVYRKKFALPSRKLVQELRKRSK